MANVSEIDFGDGVEKPARVTILFQFSQASSEASKIKVLVEKKVVNGISQYFCGIADRSGTRALDKQQTTQLLGLSPEIPGNDKSIYGPFNSTEADMFLKMVESMSAAWHFQDEAEKAERALIPKPPG